MSDDKHGTGKRLVRTTRIVTAFVANNAISANDLPRLIGSVYGALSGLDPPAMAPVVERVPAVPISKSVTSDFIVCLDDGKKYKMMKRHLASLGMTPQAYRAKWDLPPEYPMVAPSYAAVRSTLAIGMGLGRKRVVRASDGVSGGGR